MSYYEILNVNQDATQKEIKSAYYKLIKQYHPDKNRNNHEAEQHTKLLNEVYFILKDPIKRLEYDDFQQKYIHLETEGSKNSPEQGTDSSKGGPLILFCEKCGKQDLSLRLSIFTLVFSFIIFSWKKSFSYILCKNCRFKYSIFFGGEVFFLGWWGIPYGVLWSIRAFIENILGGTRQLFKNVDKILLKNNEILLEIIINNFSHQINKQEVDKAQQKKAKIEKEIKGNKYRNPVFYSLIALILFFAVFISIKSFYGEDKKHDEFNHSVVNTETHLIPFKIKHYDTLKDVRKMFPNGKFTCNKNNLNCWITDSSIDGKIFVKFFRKKQLPLIGFIAWFPSEPIFVKTVRLWYHSSGESYIDPDMGSSLVWRNMGCKEDVQAVLSDDDKYIKYFIYVPSGHLKLP